MSRIDARSRPSRRDASAVDEVQALKAQIDTLTRERDEALQAASVEANERRRLHHALATARAALEDAIRPSAIKLMAGEMTAQEARTAYAVANGLAAKIRSALKETQEVGQ